MAGGEWKSWTDATRCLSPPGPAVLMVSGEPDTSGAGARSEPMIAALFAREYPRGILTHDPGVALEWVCRTAVRFLGVDGAGISLIIGGQYRGALGGTDAVMRLIGAAQFGLGEGPCFEAVTTRTPVLVWDFNGSAAAMWPVFASHIAEAPVGAFFAFPLSAGGEEDLGALAMYRRQPGRLSTEMLGAAVALADLAALVLACSPVADPVLVDLHRDLGRGPGSTAEGVWTDAILHDQTVLSQAVGMVMAGLRIDTGQALARLRGYAFATATPLPQLARDVISRQLRPRDLTT